MKENIKKQENEILNNIIEISKVTSNSKNSNVNILKARKLQKLIFEKSLGEPVIDSLGNIVLKIEGKDKNKNLLITSTLGNDVIEKEIFLTQEKLIGKGVTENLGIVTLIILANLLKNKEFNHNIYLIGVDNSKKDYAGLDYFINKFENKIDGVIDINGLMLGDLICEMQASVLLKLKFEDKNNYRNNNIVFSISNLVSKLKEEIASKNIKCNIFNLKTSESYCESVNSGEIKIKIESDSLEDIKGIEEIIKNIAKGVSSEEKVKIKIDISEKREGLKKEENKLKEIFFNIVKKIGIEITEKKEENQIRIPLLRKIDAISIGITRGNKGEQEELEINPIYTGVEQIYSVISKFDQK